MDRTDCKIVALLQKNARLSNKQLAASTDLAESTCLQRVRKLESDGVIKGYKAAIDHGSFGVKLEAMIAIKLRHHSRESLYTLYQHIQTIPEVLTAYYTSGETDLMVHVGVSDAAHLRKVLEDRFATRKEIGQTQTSIIFERFEQPLSVLKT